MIRYMYVFFVGIFLAIFVGLGISVFYQEPTPPQALAVMSSIGKDGPTATQQKEIDTFNARQQAYDTAMTNYNRNVALIILIAAVLILAIALIFAQKLDVIANGILLGGIFTLLYGIGRGMATDNNKFRFLVAAIGLGVTLLLGYTKLIRQQVAPHHPAAKK